MNKCPKSFLGTHKWVTERRLTGAGKIFVYKLKTPECELCGELQVPVAQLDEHIPAKDKDTGSNPVRDAQST